MGRARLYGFGSSLEYTLRAAADRIGVRPTQAHADLNRQLRGYPRNHNYSVCNERILPSPRLAARLKKVIALYAQGMGTFLDIACCRGAYVFEAAGRPGCRLAVGVDVWRPFIRLADVARRGLGIERARFFHTTLGEVADDPGRYGGPFHTVLLLGAYHYFFWGSPLHDEAFLDHDAILELLRCLCSHQVILSGRFEIDRCPAFIQERAASIDRPLQYDSGHFVDCARRFFHIRRVQPLDCNLMFLMTVCRPQSVATEK